MSIFMVCTCPKSISLVPHTVCSEVYPEEQSFLLSPPISHRALTVLPSYYLPATGIHPHVIQRETLSLTDWSLLPGFLITTGNINTVWPTQPSGMQLFLSPTQGSHLLSEWRKMIDQRTPQKDHHMNHVPLLTWRIM